MVKVKLWFVAPVMTGSAMRRYITKMMVEDRSEAKDGNVGEIWNTTDSGDILPVPCNCWTKKHHLANIVFIYTCPLSVDLL